VLAGSNGEAVTLSSSEKAHLVGLARDVADKAGRTRDDFAITLGCVGQSTQAVVADCMAAKQAGADYGLIIVPSYFHFAMNEAAIIGFFRAVSRTLTLWCTDAANNSTSAGSRSIAPTCGHLQLPRSGRRLGHEL
jgi:dihydrodipicolinate synthase/N-acetylneuraminate lyase